jgi:hypothetical protein
VNGQLHATAALPLAKEPRVPVGYEDGWASDPVWTKWRRENSSPYWDSNSNLSVAQPVASRYTDYATPGHEDEEILLLLFNDEKCDGPE